MLKRGMRSSLKTGLSFGITSGVITTMGLVVGLQSGTHSRVAVIGGIITIAIADALSDALGIHVAEESENVHTQKQIWASTFITLFTKLIFASTFLVPILLLDLNLAVIASIVWGLSAISVTSYLIARQENESPAKVIAEHLLIGVIVVFASHLVGEWVAETFNANLL